MLMFQLQRRSHRSRSSGGAIRRRPSSVMALLVLTLSMIMISRPAFGQWQGYNDDLSCDSPLGIDEAMLVLRGFREMVDDNYPLTYLFQSTNCHGCDATPLATLAHANATVCAKVSTKWPARLLATWTFNNKTDHATTTKVWSVERTMRFTEKARVSVEVAGNVERDPADTYRLSIDQAGGVASYRPLLYLLLAFVGFLFLTFIVQQMMKDSALRQQLGALLQLFPRPPAVADEPLDAYDAPRQQPPQPFAYAQHRGSHSSGGVGTSSSTRGRDEGNPALPPSSGLRRRRQQTASVEERRAQSRGGGASSSEARRQSGGPSSVNDAKRAKAAAGVVDAAGRGSVVATPREGARAERQEQELELDEEELLYREFDALQQRQQGGEQQEAQVEDMDHGGEAGHGQQQPPQELEQQPQEPPEEETTAAAALEEGRATLPKLGSSSRSSSKGVQHQPPPAVGDAGQGDDDDDEPSSFFLTAPLPRLPRERALDVVRGLSVLSMVFVNYGGGGYAFFEHSAWDGLAFADILFPTFVFVSGAAAALSLRQLRWRLDLLQPPRQRPVGNQVKEEDEEEEDGGDHRQRRRLARRVWAVKREALGKVLRRSLVLSALGLFMNNGYEVSHWRVPGVLQYLAWCNLLVPALLILAMPASGKQQQQHQHQGHGATGEPRPFQVIARTLLPSCWWEPCAALLLPTLHLGLTYLVAAPGCPRGYVGPGGTMVAGGQYAGCTGGAHGYLDRLLFSPAHILQDPPCRHVYGTGAYDPEGAVGSLTAAFLFYIGVLAGRVVAGPWPRRSAWRPFLWLGLALPAAILAGALGASGAIPVNKSLWSLSFILATAAIDLAVLAGVHFLCDGLRLWTSGAPFACVGRNALAVYVGHELLQDYFPFSFQVPAALEATHGGALLENVVGTAMWVAVAGLLHWRRVYLKV